MEKKDGMKSKELTHNPIYGDNYRDCELAKLGMRRLQFLSIPLIANSFCVVMSIFNVSLSSPTAYFIGFAYAFILASVYHGRLEGKEISLFRDFNRLLSHRNNFFTTPDLPANPPLSKGYLYARKPEEEFSRPYPMEAYIIESRKDINFNTEYAFHVELANYVWDGSGYGNKEWNEFKLKCLKDFESLGYVVEALKDEMGEYLWYKGALSKQGKIDKYLDIGQMILFKGLVVASILTPFLFLGKFINWT